MAAKRAKKAAKKSASKPAKKVAKRAVKKASSGKSAKKSTSRAKKSAKRVAKKSAKKSARAGVSLKVDVPEVPRRGVVTPTSTPTAKPKTPSTSNAVSAPEKKKNGSSPFFFIIIGIVALALIFISQGSSDSKDSKDSGSGTVAEESADDMGTSDESMEGEEETDEMSASEDATDDASSDSTENAGTPTAYEGPTGIVAQYTKSDKSAATIFWKAPASTDGVTGYAIQIQRNGGARADLSSTPATQFSLDITKSDTSGWTSFIVQTVYSDGTVTDGKVFGLPGQWQ